MFFDDILIYSKDRAEHEKHLKSVLDKLTEVGLKLNKEKCELRKDEIEYLGFRINAEGIHPDKSKHGGN